MKKIYVISVFFAGVFLAAGAVFYISQKKLVDYTPPVIEMASDRIECSIEATDEELKAGVTAFDDKDGDLTNRIMIDDIQIREEEDDSSEEKTFDITYVVFDSNNNVASATRTLVYTDYTSPRFSILNSLQFTSVSAVELYSLLEATDCIDGSITNQISIDMSEAFQDAVYAGEYTCNVSVTNSLGDMTTLPLAFDVIMADATRPTINLTDYMVYLKRGEKFHPSEYLDSVVIDNVRYQLVSESEVGTDLAYASDYNYGHYLQKYGPFILKKKINISSGVETDQPGTYQVVYSFRHPEEETRGFVRLFVVVE